MKQETHRYIPECYRDNRNVTGFDTGVNRPACHKKLLLVPDYTKLSNWWRFEFDWELFKTNCLHGSKTTIRDGSIRLAKIAESVIIIFQRVTIFTAVPSASYHFHGGPFSELPFSRRPHLIKRLPNSLWRRDYSSGWIMCVRRERIALTRYRLQLMGWVFAYRNNLQLISSNIRWKFVLYPILFSVILP
jgi:hypothetical protein